MSTINPSGGKVVGQVSNQQLAEAAKVIAEFQEVVGEARIAVTRIIAPGCNADPKTQQGAMAHFAMIPELGKLSNDDLLGVAMSAVVALVQLHRQPKLRVVDIYPGIVDKPQRA